MSIFHLIISLICLFSIFPLSTTSSYFVSYVYLLPSSSCPMSVYHLSNISPLNTFYLFSSCPLKLQLLCYCSSNYHYFFTYSFSSICLLSSIWCLCAVYHLSSIHPVYIHHLLFCSYPASLIYCHFSMLCLFSICLWLILQHSYTFIPSNYHFLYIFFAFLIYFCLIFSSYTVSLQSIIYLLMIL